MSNKALKLQVVTDKSDADSEPFPQPLPSSTATLQRENNDGHAATDVSDGLGDSSERMADFAPSLYTAVALIPVTEVTKSQEHSTSAAEGELTNGNSTEVASTFPIRVRSALFTH
jgi:thiamine monophosphate kinase